MTTASHDDVAALGALGSALRARARRGDTERSATRSRSPARSRRMRPSCSTCLPPRRGARFRDRHPLSLPGDVRALARGRATLRHDDRGVRGPDCGGADGDARREALGAQSRSLPRGRQAHTARPRARRARRWITGVRRDQSPTRAGAPRLGWDAAHELWKANPLADWTDDDCWAYIRERGAPYNPLHDQGYASIGDTHSTIPGEGRTAAGPAPTRPRRAPRRRRLAEPPQGAEVQALPAPKRED